MSESSKSNQHIYFEFNGLRYRTDGKTVEGLDGSTWNQTGSLPVVLYARKEWARIRKNAARRERNEAMRSLGLTRVRGNLGGIYWE